MPKVPRRLAGDGDRDGDGVGGGPLRVEEDIYKQSSGQGRWGKSRVSEKEACFRL